MDVREKQSSKKQLIDREALLSFEKMDAELCASCGEHHTAEDVIMMIKTAPTVDAVEVVHGYDTGHCRVFQCSECGYGLIDIYQDDEKNYPVGEFNYCPNCGAKIDGGFDYLSGEYTKRTPCNVPTAVCGCRCQRSRKENDYETD